MMPKQNKNFDIRQFNLTPIELKQYLDRYIVGQEHAKIVLSNAVCAHYKRIQHEINYSLADLLNTPKQNVLFVGPTGVGKTAMVKVAAFCLGVPMVEADANNFTVAGYVGDDVESLPRKLYYETNDTELAQLGIIFIDEIDKLRKDFGLIGRDITGQGVQEALLKMMEGREVEIYREHDRRRDYAATISTNRILFVMSGQFDGLSEIVNKRINPTQIGFTQEFLKPQGYLDEPVLEDFVAYGFDKQFIGRIPNRAVLSRLSSDELYQILKLENSPLVEAKKREYAGYGISLEFDDNALKEIALLAASKATGARGLADVLDKLLKDFYFHLPSRECNKLHITLELLRDPQTKLEKMLSDYAPRIASQPEAQESTSCAPQPQLTIQSYTTLLNAHGVNRKYVRQAAEFGMYFKKPPAEMPNAIRDLFQQINSYEEKFKHKFGKELVFTRKARTVLITQCLERKRQSVEDLIYHKVGRHLENKQLLDNLSYDTISVSSGDLVDPNHMIERLKSPS